MPKKAKKAKSAKTGKGAVVPTVERTSEEQAMQNPLILSEILRHLPLTDIKSTRLVSQMWRQESRKPFYQKSAVNLDLSKYNENNYNRQLQNHRNFKLQVPFSSKHVNQEMEASLLLKLKEFTTVRNSSIKSLQILAKINWSGYLKLFKSVLGVYPNITSLDLDFGGFAEFSSLTTSILDETEPLLLVSKLRINFGSRFRTFAYNILRDFVRQLLRLTPNICELALHKDIVRSNNFEVILSEIVKLQGDVFPGEPLAFRNLSTLHFENWDDKLPSVCLGMSQQLRVLSLKKIPYLSSDCSANISKLLEKHSDSLESLTVSYESWGKNKGKVAKFVYPNLPRLAYLLVSVIETKAPILADIFGIKKMLSMGAVKFEEKFPTLHSIHIDMPTMKQERVSKLFIPQPDETENVVLCYNQINSFKLSCICDDWIRADKSFAHLSQMFPNGAFIK